MSTDTIARPGLAGNNAIGVKVIDVYCRISRDNDGTTHSVDEQELDCLDRIDEEPGWTVGRVFKDHALSAWNPKTKRGGFEDMMDRLESGQSHGVLVYDLARFSRKPAEGERLLTMAKRGIVVASITTTYNLTTADGRKQFRDKMTANAHESDLISERSTRGKRNKAKRRGKSNMSIRGFARPGWAPNPPGWEPGDPRTPVPDSQLRVEIAAVQDAAKRILSGEADQTVIAREWNERGILTTRGGRWDGGTVRHMLEAPAIGGGVHYQGRENIVAWNGDGPLDRETWERLCSALVVRKRGARATTYLLSGIARCGECGGFMYGRPMSGGSSGKGTGDETVKPIRRQYWCQIRVRENVGCGRVTIERTFAEDVVEALVVGRLSDPRHADRVARVAAALAEEHRVLRLELSRLNSEMDELMEKAGTTRLWTPARVEKALAQYEEPVANLEARLAVLEEQPVGATSASGDAQADWDAATLDGKRAMVKRAFPEGLVIKRAKSQSRAQTFNAKRIVPGELLH